MKLFIYIQNVPLGGGSIDSHLPTMLVIKRKQTGLRSETCSFFSLTLGIGIDKSELASPIYVATPLAYLLGPIDFGTVMILRMLGILIFLAPLSCLFFHSFVDE